MSMRLEHLSSSRWRGVSQFDMPAALASTHSRLALSACLTTAAVTPALGALPCGMRGSAAGLLGATLALALGGATQRATVLFFVLFFGAWTAAGTLSSAIAALQGSAGRPSAVEV